MHDRLGEVSGSETGYGQTANPDGTTTEAPRLDQLVNGIAGELAEAFGEHLVQGYLIATKHDDGPPPSSRFIQALGAGEWDSTVGAWYAGDPIDESPDDTTPGYHFHPGTISTGIADPVQGVDSFLPDGIAYNGTAYVAVLLPEKYSVEDTPGKFIGRYRCKKIWDYDLQGNPLNYAYSFNPADVAVHHIRRSYDLKYPNDPAYAYQLFRDRVNWASYTEWWNYNAALIEWDDGTSVRNIPRFECHLAFTGAVDLGAALDQICACAGAFWQDDGEQYYFVTPAPHDPIHHFHYDPTTPAKSNIVSGSVSVTPTDIRSRPNYLVAKFRNLDDEYLGGTGSDPYSATVAKRSNLISKIGIVKSERVLPNMRYSQAQRLAERQLRIEADNPRIVTLKGDGTSLHVLKGDYVSITHPILDFVYQKALVLSTSVDSAEKSADETEFSLLPFNEELYSDKDQKKIQESLEP